MIKVVWSSGWVSAGGMGGGTWLLTGLLVVKE